MRRGHAVSCVRSEGNTVLVRLRHDGWFGLRQIRGSCGARDARPRPARTGLGHLPRQFGPARGLKAGGCACPSRAPSHSGRRRAPTADRGNPAGGARLAHPADVIERAAGRPLARAPLFLTERSRLERGSEEENRCAFTPAGFRVFTHSQGCFVFRSTRGTNHRMSSGSASCDGIAYACLPCMCPPRCYLNSSSRQVS